MRHTLAFALVVVAAAVCCGEAAARERITVRGSVVAPDGQPMPGLHVMVFDGERRVPPFMIRPKAFGLPLPNVRVVETDDQGRFAVEHVRPGCKTVLVGEEGLLLYGTAATRTIDANGEPFTIRLDEEELESYRTIADRAERATEVVEDILIEVDLALGWYIETRERVADAEVAFYEALEEHLGIEAGPDAPRSGGRLTHLARQARQRIEELLGQAEE